MSLRRSIRNATANNFWTRYLSAASHRLAICAREWLFGVSDYALQRDQRSYAETVLSYYRAFSGGAGFYGHAIEVGAGRSNHFAELLLASGCERVDLLDRFQHQPSSNPCIRRFVGPAERFFPSDIQYDLIMSAAVLEHLYDPISALRGMWRSLKPGGRMIHVIDLRDHELFSPFLHDLSFLRLTDAAYWPFRVQGGPNRLRAPDFERCVAALSGRYSLYVTSIAGERESFLSAPRRLSEMDISRSIEHVRSVRPRLARKFKRYSDRDLAITGIAVSIHKA